MIGLSVDKVMQTNRNGFTRFFCWYALLLPIDEQDGTCAKTTTQYIMPKSKPIVWIRAFHASLLILVSRFISILLLNSHFRSIMRLEGAITHDLYSRYYFAWCCLTFNHLLELIIFNSSNWLDLILQTTLIYIFNLLNIGHVKIALNCRFF